MFFKTKFKQTNTEENPQNLISTAETNTENDLAKVDEIDIKTEEDLREETAEEQRDESLDDTTHTQQEFIKYLFFNFFHIFFCIHSTC